MQISEKLGQYSRNVTNGTEELRGAQGVQKMVSSVGEMSKGSIFEGTVNHVRGGKVTLALGNGQVILARLEGKMDLKPGTSMFFQVRENDGATVSIRPYTGPSNSGNPILLNALTTAQVPVSERMLAMVDAMMQEQMPVNKQSILNMAKLLGNFPDVNVQTLVQMTKLGLPVTEVSAGQFENYLSNRHAILGEMELAVGQIAEAVVGEEGTTVEESFDLYGKLLDIFLPDGEQSGSLPGEGGVSESMQAAVPQAGESGIAREAGMMPGDGSAQGAPVAQTSAGTLGTLLTPEQLAALEKTLQNIPTLTGNTELFAEEDASEVFVDTLQDDSVDIPGQAVASGSIVTGETLDKNMPAEVFLKTLQSALAQNSEYGFAGVGRLFASKEFQTLLKGVIEEQWLIRPQDLKEEKKIDKLYETMERQMQQVEAALKASGTTQASFAQTAADVRGNIEFMNQMNQIYNYIQMPLKLSGQNANGELYVYRNSKRAYEPGEELTAFLHLDLENLGSTDVSVRMINRQVKTNFYLENDAAYTLIEQHMPILEKRLKSKGYNCTVTVTHDKKEINFKENFMRKGNAAPGSLHRYSFDVRA